MTSLRAAAAVRRLGERRLTVATAESLTGGLVCAALTDVPGASSVVRGAVVSYANELKSGVLGVDAALLRSQGAVQPEVAGQMAVGVCLALGSDVGIATTGVAGPDPSDGQPVGTVYVAVALPVGGSPADRGGSPQRVEVRRLDLPGDRAAVRAATVDAALALLLETLG